MQELFASDIAGSRFDQDSRASSMALLDEAWEKVSSMQHRENVHAALLARERSEDYTNCVPFVAMVIFLFAALVLLFCLTMPADSPFY